MRIKTCVWKLLRNDAQDVGREVSYVLKKSTVPPVNKTQGEGQTERQMRLKLRRCPHPVRSLQNAETTLRFDINILHGK